MLDGIRGVFSREAPHRTLTLAPSIIDGRRSAFFLYFFGFLGLGGNVGVASSFGNASITPWHAV